MHSATDVKDNIPKCYSHWNFHEPRIFHFSSNRKYLGSFASFCTDLRVPICPAINYHWHIGPGLYIVNIGRFAPEAGDRGVGGARSGLTQAALNRSHQGRLFAAHKGPGAPDHLDVKVESGVEDVLPQEAVFPSLVDGDSEPLHGQGVFVADVDVALVGAHGVGADEHSFQD